MKGATVIEHSGLSKGMLPATDKNIRVFGLGLAAILGSLWAIRYFIYERGLSPALLGAVIAFAVLGAFLPKVLKPIYVVWIWIAHKIGLANTYVLLFLVFYALLTPLALLLRLLGKHQLDLGIDKSRKSYWESHEGERTKEYYEREF